MPKVDQIAPGAFSTDPFNTTPELLVQVVSSAPAFTTGTGTKFKATSSVTSLQVPFPEVVSSKFTEPAAVSAAEGMYCAFK